MGLPGVIGHEDHTEPRRAFSSAWTQPEGAKEAFVFEARITNVNMKNWTVDCASVFDRRFWGDIQVASPYVHSANGEGMYAVPEVGAKCMVCLPSDGPPPFVLMFIMASEKITTGDKTTGFTYGGGRGRPKPGDIVLKGRDGNFCILHRGGVLQVGSTDLAQRIYIPLGNLITDISENYSHFNSGGSVNWGVRSTAPDEDLDTEFRQAFRVYANDKFADVRLAVGKVQIPVLEPAGDAGETTALEQLGIANSKEKPIIFELVVAPGGFDTDAGQPNKDARDATKLRLFFDRAGGAMLRSEAAVDIRVKKDLWIKSDKTLRLKGKDGVLIESGPNSAYLRMTGEASVELGTGGGVLTLNSGTKPVAHVGSMVQVTLVAPIPITTTAGPGTILAGAVMMGFVTTGNPTIKV
jgi:hypothetical protein